MGGEVKEYQEGIRIPNFVLRTTRSSKGRLRREKLGNFREKRKMFGREMNRWGRKRKEFVSL